MPRSIVRNWKAISNAEINTSPESEPTDAAFLDKGRAYIEWAGANILSARLEVLISNDKETWRDIIEPTAPIVLDSASGSHEVSFPNIDFAYLKFRVDANGETLGSVNISFTASTVGK